ncbi:MAG: M23 family metallopeptidase [Desulfobaccales bacterium]|nr:M23 family metallopeptidase [Desulfobaccales bacterium]
MRKFKFKLKLNKQGLEKQTGRLLINLLRGALVAVVLWFIFGSLDWYDPWIAMKPEVNVLGPRTGFIIEAGDNDSGVRDIRVVVKQGDQEKEVLARTFPSTGFWGAKGSRFTKVEIPVMVDAKALDLKEGKATLVVTAHDQSWRNHFRGRLASLTREVDVHLVPLNLTFLSVNHLLHHGGTGLILYKLNKPAKESGVMIGGHFYVAYPNPKGASDEYQVLFPVPRESSGPDQVELVARPAVGEEARLLVPLKVKPRRWRQDRLNLSEGFLRKVAADFPGPNPADPLAAFLEVNREMRRANHEKVRQVCATSQPKPLWAGAFQRFLGKPMARFGDRRTYFYQGRQVDQQVHLGEDLASLEHNPVPAANHGEVVMAEPLGIYGQTVILDHGLGVFSMYSHLSQIEVKPGEQVGKGATLGRTGTTGLAGGDHLHFSMIIQGEFVDPLEWWDSHWLKDQVEGQWAKAGVAEGARAAAQPPKAAKGKGKKTKSQAKPGKGKRRE